MKSIGLISLFLLSTSIYAKPFCHKLSDCVQKVSKLTDKKYIYDAKDLKGTINITNNYKVTKENADLFLSAALNKNGYTRVPFKTGLGDGYEIVENRDIRYTATPMFHAEKEAIPHTYDYIMVTFKLKGVSSTEITRSFRPFMSRYGRLIDIKANNTIIIQDTGVNAKRLYDLAKGMDYEPTEEQLEQRKEREEEKRELEKLKAKNCSYLSEELSSISRKIDQLKSKH